MFLQRIVKLLPFFLLLNCGGNNASLLTQVDPTSAPAFTTEEQDFLATYVSRQTQYFSDDANASVWGSIQAMRSYSIDGEFAREQDLRVNGYGGFTTKVLAKIQPHPAPLMLVFPGIGATHNNDSSWRKLYLYASRGYHVVVFQNPFSPDFIASAPGFRPGDLIEEGRFFLRAAQSIRWQIGTGNIQKTHVVGNSYGGFLSAVIAAMDAESEEPVIDGTVTLWGPPLNFRHSIAAVDGTLNNEQGFYEEVCDSIILGIGFIRDFGSAKSESDLDLANQGCARSRMAYDGFHTTLVDAAKATDETYGLGILPFWPWERSAFFSSLRFRSFVSLFSPAAEELLRDDYLVWLTYWIDLARSKGQNRIRILTAKDDFLNHGLSWEDNPFVQLDGTFFQSFPWGGHHGFVALSWFDQLQSIGYGERLPDFPAFHRLKNPWIGADKQKMLELSKRR